MWRGVPLPGSVVYEMHVGTFTPEGTLDAAIGKLDHLVALGVDIVEVMPLATFPGGSAGATTASVCTPCTSRTAGRKRSSRFVDACHRRGIGICLDVVYNHLGPSGNHLSEFGPYFTARYGTPWGAALNLDDADSDEVRRFIDRQRADVVPRLPRRRAAARRGPRTVRHPRHHAARGAVGRGQRTVGGSRSAARADRGVRPQRPTDGRAARGRRPRACTPSGPTTCTMRCTSC